MTAQEKQRASSQDPEKYAGGARKDWRGLERTSRILLAGSSMEDKTVEQFAGVVLIKILFNEGGTCLFSCAFFFLFLFFFKKKKG